MAGRNDFLTFDENKQDMLDQAAYTGHSQRQSGVKGGIADSKLHNKLFRQTSIMAAAVGEVIKSKGLVAADDDLPALTQNLVAAFTNSEPVSDPTKVNKAGDTMTGQLSVPSLTIGGYTPWHTGNLPIENGAWTPEVEAAMLSSSWGRYRRLGPFVVCVFDVYLASKSSETGMLRVTGLPFEGAFANLFLPSGSIYAASNYNSSINSIGFGISSGASLLFKKWAHDVNDFIYLSDVNNNFTLTGSILYGCSL